MPEPEMMSMQQSDCDKLERHFFVSRREMDNAVWSGPASELLETAQMSSLISVYARLLKAADLAPAATFFSGWLSGPALAVQYAMSVWNKTFDLSLNNLSVQLYNQDGYYRFSFMLNRWAEQDGPADEAARTEWRSSVLQDVYGNTLRPLLEAVAAASGVHVGQLWGQLPARYHYERNEWLKAAEHELLRRRIADDFRFLTEQLDPQVFGQAKNPLGVKLRLIEDLCDSERHVSIKSACCLYYRTEGGRYCYTCPRLKEAKRAEMRASMRAEAAQTKA
jgi:ferric iron reductase protein FhuF